MADIEKDIIKLIKNKLKSSSKTVEENIQKKREIIDIIGLNSTEENNEDFFEIKNKNFVKKVMPEIIEELLCGSHIDLDLLKKIVKVQNGIFNFELTDTVKDAFKEGMIKDIDSISPLENMKKVMFHMKEGNMEVDSEFLEELESMSPQLFKLSKSSFDDDDAMRFSNQIALQEKETAGIRERREQEIKEEYIKKEAILDVNWREEARKEFYKKIEMMNAIERRYYKDDKSLDKKSNNAALDWAYGTYYKIKKSLANPLEQKSLVMIDPETNTPLTQVFKYPLIGKGVRFDKFPERADAAQVYEIAALKVRSDGIEKPHVFTKRATSHLEKMAAIDFVKGQLNALIKVGYDIDDFRVYT